MPSITILVPLGAACGAAAVLLAAYGVHAWIWAMM